MKSKRISNSFTPDETKSMLYAFRMTSKDHPTFSRAPGTPGAYRKIMAMHEKGEQLVADRIKEEADADEISDDELCDQARG